MTAVQDERTPTVGQAEASAIVSTAMETFSAAESGTTANGAIGANGAPGAVETGVGGGVDPLPDPSVEPPVDPDGTGIEAIKARLAARGLLQTGPAILVPKEPRPESPIWTEPLFPEVPPQEVPEDEWDVSPEGSGNLPHRCIQCREVRPWPADVTRFRCQTCDRAWRWAVCGGCDGLQFTIERQESWRCTDCGQINRSWWRTISAQRDGLQVVGRRRHAAAEAEKARVRAGMRKRRWKIIAGALVGLLLVGMLVVGIRLSEPTREGGTNVTCAHFDRLRSALSSGTIDGPAIDRELELLKQESANADPRIGKAVVDLVAAGRPGKGAFLVAQTALADACDAAQS